MAEPELSTTSRRLFDAVVAPYSPMTIKTEVEKSLKRRREHVIGNLCQAIKRDGKWLYSHPDDGGQHALQASFSKHGSVYHRLHLREINDIDVYVVLYGAGLTYRGERLLPRPHSVTATDNPNARAFGASFADHKLGDSDRAVQWMVRVLKAAMPAEAHRIKQTPGRRGAVLSSYGSNSMSFDFIPVFLAKGDRENFHVLPDGRGGWQRNPTERVMRGLDKAAHDHPRDQLRKVLGLKDIIKVLKFLKRKDSWESRNGVTSFVIKYAVEKVSPRFRSQVLNQVRIQIVIDQINEWISRGGFIDPYTGQKFELRRPVIPVTEDLFRKVITARAP